jgi:alpha-glucosidase
MAYCLLSLVVITFVFWFARRVRRRTLKGQIVGALYFDASALPARTYSLEDFTLTWEPMDGGGLMVRHQAVPDRILWSTLPGESFVAAAQGFEKVTQSRGHFAIQDRLRLVCTEQAIDAITVGGDTVTITGRVVYPERGASVGYVLTFAPLSPNQLGFALRLIDDGDAGFNRAYLTYASSPDERFFGFGEQFSFFDLKGKRLPIFVMEQGIGRGAQPVTFGANLKAMAGGAWHTTYAGVPHYISSHCRSLCLETYEYVEFDMRAGDRVQIGIFALQMSGRIFYGESPEDLIREYTAFAGRMRPLPDWILRGAVVGLQGGTDRVRELYARLKAHATPLAAIWLQDWVGQRRTSFGQQLWWNWELDREHYPDWDVFVGELASEGVNILTYVNPHFAVDAAEKPCQRGKPGVRRDLYREAEENGYLILDEGEEAYPIRNSDFWAGMLDLTKPAACSWMKNVLEEQVIGVGASGWMADYAEGLPYDAVLHSAGDAAAYHNQYPEDWAKLNREAIEETGRGDELVFFTRSGYLRSPGFTTLFWLGDQLVSWDEHDGIKTAVVGLLSSGLSGFSLNHSDIGGFTTINSRIRNYHRSKELLWRWIELNAFTAVFRTHEGSRPEQNHQVYSDEETLAHFSRFAKVYRAWGFYRAHLVQEAAEIGLPVVRHPFIHYPDDPNVYGLSYQQFMLGMEFMIAPVLDSNKDEVSVYMPAGRWVHLWSGATYGSPDNGVTVTAAAPLGQPGVFYRQGSPVGAQFVANLQRLGILA